MMATKLPDSHKDEHEHHGLHLDLHMDLDLHYFEQIETCFTDLVYLLVCLSCVISVGISLGPCTANRKDILSVWGIPEVSF